MNKGPTRLLVTICILTFGITTLQIFLRKVPSETALQHMKCQLFAERKQLKQFVHFCRIKTKLLERTQTLWCQTNHEPVRASSSISMVSLSLPYVVILGFLAYQCSTVSYDTVTSRYLHHNVAQYYGLIMDLSLLSPSTSLNSKTMLS